MNAASVARSSIAAPRFASTHATCASAFLAAVLVLARMGHSRPAAMLVCCAPCVGRRGRYNRPYGARTVAFSTAIGGQLVGKMPVRRMFRRSGHRFADKNMRQMLTLEHV